MKKSVTRNRLLKLAEFLREVPRDRFDFGEWFTGELKPKCGTVGCAMGWATQCPALKKAGLKQETKQDEYGSVTVVTFKGQEGFLEDIALDLFGITGEEVNYLFIPDQHSDYGYSGGMSSTPKQVARKIERFVEKYYS